MSIEQRREYRKGQRDMLQSVEDTFLMILDHDKQVTMKTVNDFIQNHNATIDKQETEEELAARNQKEPIMPEEKTTKPAMLLWDWWDAPEKYRALSRHGGDEDYVLVVPDEIYQTWGKDLPPEIERMCNDWQSFPVFAECVTVYIGAHA